MLLSDKFKAGRKRNVPLKQTTKKQISFNKFIKRAKDLSQKPEYDLIADFEFFDVNCEYCLKQYSKVVPLYVVSTEELKLKQKRGETVNYLDPDIVLKCANCFQEKRIIDIRRHTNLGTLIPIDTGQEYSGFRNAKDSRNEKLTDLLPNEVKRQYDKLLNMSKTKNVNKTVAKELEHYVKKYRNISKKYKGKPFEKDYETLNSMGLELIKLDNIDILIP